MHDSCCLDPPTIVVSPRNVTMVEHQPLTLFCNASGFPPPNITWYKDGGVAVQHGDTLSIKNVTRKDEGSYRCVVNNGLECDIDSAVSAVTVNCKSKAC